MNKIITTSKNRNAGSSCNTMEEHTPHNRDVVGLNPAACWAFSSLP